MTRKAKASHRLRLVPLEERTLLSTTTSSAIYGHLPLAFEQNVGQAVAGINYLSHGPAYTLTLSRQGAALDPPPNSGASAVSFNLAGANPAAQALSQDELITKTNYIAGSDPSQWLTNIPNYGQVEYQNVYPGIDVTYYGNQGQLEYDFTVAPGANPSAIRMNIQGATGLSLNAVGDLVIQSAGANLTEEAPVVYQVIDGVRQAVSGHFVLLPSQDPASTTHQSPLTTYQVGFQLGAYDHSQALVIDPVLVYSFTLSDQPYAIGVDSAGEAYVAGGNFSTGDVMVAKLNAAGSAFIYQTYIGQSGSQGDIADGIAIDSAGDAYIVGGPDSNFPTTANALSTTPSDMFLTELNPTGANLLYSTFIPGGYDLYPVSVPLTGAVAVDGAGQVFVTGAAGAGLVTTAGAYQPSFAGGSTGYNAFLAEFNPSLSGSASLLYGSYLGGSQAVATGIALDSSANAYITGWTDSTNFPTTAGAFQTTAGGSIDAFVAKFNTSLSGTPSLVYSTYLGGSGKDGIVPNPFPSWPGPAIAVDGSGDAYVVGETNSTNFPTTPGAFQTAYAGPAAHGADAGGDAFVTKLNAAGSGLVYSTYLGGSGNDGATSVAVAADGDATVAGFTGSTNFPTMNPVQSQNEGTQSLGYGGPTNGFVTTLNASGSAPVFSTYLGGTSTELLSSVALDSSGGIYVTGFTVASNGGIIDKIGFSPSFQVSGFPSPTTAGVAHSFTVTALNANGTVNTSYTGTVTFTSSDAKAVLPANYTFTPANQGVYTFTATLETAGSQSITVTDTTTNTITGSESGITVQPAAASQFVLSGPSSVTSGSKFSMTLTAEDAYGNVATGYTGTVKFTSSDKKATLPSNYTFTAGDAGVYTFSNGFVLKTTGMQSITATDTKNSALTTTIDIQVGAAPAAALSGGSDGGSAMTLTEAAPMLTSGLGEASSNAALEIGADELMASLPTDWAWGDEYAAVLSQLQQRAEFN